MDSDAESDIMIVNCRPTAPPSHVLTGQISSPAVSALPQALSNRLQPASSSPLEEGLTHATAIIDAALTIFASTSVAASSSRDRAQEVLAKEVLSNTPKKMRIALALYESPHTWAHNRKVAQALLQGYTYQRY
jgi:hypothetical protein